VLLGRTKPRRFETWHRTATLDRVEIAKRDTLERPSCTFPREALLVDGQLPAPAP
jgi:hypothetical protein